jgi:hypothetical protein
MRLYFYFDWMMILEVVSCFMGGTKNITNNTGIAKQSNMADDPCSGWTLGRELFARKKKK